MKTIPTVFIIVTSVTRPPVASGGSACRMSGLNVNVSGIFY